MKPIEWDQQHRAGFSKAELRELTLILYETLEHPRKKLKKSDIYKHARKWWNKSGRHQMKLVANQEVVGEKFIAAGGHAPAIKIGGEKQIVYPSGILMGEPFERLDKRETIQVMKVWYVEKFLRALLDGRPLPIDYRLGIAKHPADQTIAKAAKIMAEIHKRRLSS